MPSPHGPYPDDYPPMDTNDVQAGPTRPSECPNGASGPIGRASTPFGRVMEAIEEIERRLDRLEVGNRFVGPGGKVGPPGPDYVGGGNNPLQGTPNSGGGEGFPDPDRDLLNAYVERTERSVRVLGLLVPESMNLGEITALRRVLDRLAP